MSAQKGAAAAKLKLVSFADSTMEVLLQSEHIWHEMAKWKWIKKSFMTLASLYQIT
jgi:hypothetical protein